jgi:hypothetical protein
MHRIPEIQAILDGQTIEFDGFQVTKADGPIEPGDTYLAGRNMGPKLLTARLVDTELGCIYPNERVYPYDLHECVKVEISL